MTCVPLYPPPRSHPRLHRSQRRREQSFCHLRPHGRDQRVLTLLIIIVKTAERKNNKVTSVGEDCEGSHTRFLFLLFSGCLPSACHEDEDMMDDGHNTRQGYFSNVPPSSFIVARLSLDCRTRVSADPFRVTTNLSISTIFFGITLEIHTVHHIDGRLPLVTSFPYRQS